MKLELKHLVGYLPYGLKCEIKINENILIETITGIDSRMDYPNHYGKFGNIIPNTYGMGVYGDKSILLDRIKPILHPHSDIVNIEDVLIYDVIGTDLENFDEQQLRDFLSLGVFDFLPNIIIQKLYELHFDIHGLIENDLAISIHDVAQADA